MQFTVLPVRGRLPQGVAGMFLERDAWDDFSYKTLFHLHYSSSGHSYVSIGAVKIAHLGMADGGMTPVPERFEELPHEFFSLGQDVSYYEQLKALGPEIRMTVLRSLRDVALDLELFRRLTPHPAMQTSLLRTQAPATVTGQYHRIATGGRTLIEQHFSYVERKGQLLLRFDVRPQSQPPTNVHVLIGSNGVGKTQLLNALARAAVRPNDPDNVGDLHYPPQESGSYFVNVISISFSAFDSLRPVTPLFGIKYDHVTLDRAHNQAGRTPAQQFVEVVRSLVGERRVRWLRALESLGADPLLRDALQALTASSATTYSDSQVEAVFDNLSSGHKIVTLAVSYLADLVAEGTLVLIDEPETHLHPPLLASFVSSLSELLVDRNGIAIIATHSPVVLQEAPRSCVWKIHRVGTSRTAVQPDLETFGENVGTLTREVFGLEITRSGFHRRLTEAVAENLNYEAVIDRFDGNLGTEARAIIRALIAARDAGSR